MALIERWNGPVNPAQVILATGGTSCVVRANDDDGTVDVDVQGVSTPALLAALASLTYNPEIVSAE